MVIVVWLFGGDCDLFHDDGLGRFVHGAGLDPFELLHVHALFELADDRVLAFGYTGFTPSLAEVFMKSRMTEMATFGSVRRTYDPKEVRNGFCSTG